MKKLETSRMILRDWNLEDKEDLFEYAQTDLVGPNAGWKPHENIQESIDIISMFIKDNDVFAVELKEENKLIGGVGIHERYQDPKLAHLKQVEIGYVLNPKYWGRGFIPEAVDKVIEYCFETLEMDLIWCGYYSFNERSKRVNDKCGFKYHLTKDEVLERLDNKPVTTLYHILTKEEYLRRKDMNDVL